MWKIMLDKGLWLSKGKYGSEITTIEADAWLLPSMQTVQAQLKRARRYMPYKNAMVIAEFNQVQ